MSIALRHDALRTAYARTPLAVQAPSAHPSDYFGSNVFGGRAMQQYLTEDVHASLMAASERGEKLPPDTAGQVAAGMKNWAIANGATHYTHWFQPLTGATAEKHDSFFTLTHDGRALEAFSGSALVQQEPDASSFPSGGIRNTFEARGYTAWDPSSPAFLFEGPSGKTLCIPTIFVSYTGESLDYKSPLLKSIAFIEREAVEVCQLFDRTITKVSPTLGVEQEYFLVDAALFAARPDLVLGGRTLVGHAPARGQQLEDHYFGSIPVRVQSFMADFEIEAHKLGIPLKTRHNEVAPGQFECAPTFEEINLAVDHNQLLMDLMERVARRHGLAVLLHEKPFAGINGSGKHNNWSLATNTGKNLLSPGRTPKNNLQFLTFFVNIIAAFDAHAPLIRAAIAGAGNDHRLGANEAPPAIMSVFLGQHLSAVLDEVERADFSQLDSDAKGALRLGIQKIPEILLDNTDRNRTSPMAFTGNKFELRAVGSSANCASAMTVLNTAVADQLRRFKEEVGTRIGNGQSRDKAVLEVLRALIAQSKRVRFEGNGYGQEWVEEAERRGLPNIMQTPLALDAISAPEAVELFVANGIYTERELHARQEIQWEMYTKKVQIEARTLGEMCLTQVVPAALRSHNELLQGLALQKQLAMPHPDALMAQAETMATHLAEVVQRVNAMTEHRRQANKIEDIRTRALYYAEHVLAAFEGIRYHVDKLELLVDDGMWPLPKYRELLFIR